MQQKIKLKSVLFLFNQLLTAMEGVDFRKIGARILLVASFFICSNVGKIVNGQSLHPSFYELTEKQGLPGNHVYFVYQDSEKYIWIATKAGVARYDGINFEVFTVDEGMTDNTVFTIWEDSQNRIWMLTYAGIPCFYQDGKIFNPANTPFLRELLFDSYLSSIYEDESGTVFLGGKDGRLYSIDLDEKVRLEYDTDLYSIHYQFSNAKGQHCFVPNYLSLYVHKPSGYQLSVFNIDTVKGETPRFTTLPNRDLLGGKGSSLFRVNSKIESRPILLEEPNQITGQIINMYPDGEYTWICTTNGVFQMRFKDSLVPEIKHYFPEIMISSTFRDHEGGMWFGTPHGALYCPVLNILTNRKPFASIQNPVTALASGILQGRRVTYLGYEDGSVSILSPENMQEVVLFQIPKQGSSRQITQITPVNEQGELLVNGHEGIFKFREGKVQEILYFAVHQLAQFPGKPDCLCHYGGYSLTDLSRADNDQNVLSEQKRRAAGKNARCYAVKYDLEGRLWIAESNRIRIQWNGKEKIINFRNRSGLAFRPSVIAVSPDGEIWLGTIGAGLFRYDGKKVWNYHPGNGIPSKIVNTLHFDSRGRVWVGTDKGLSYFKMNDNPDRPAARLVGKGDGLPGSNVSAILACGDDMLIATDVGLTTIPWNRKPDSRAPLTRITEILVNGEPIHPGFESPTFSYEENSIGIRFTGISYRSLSEIQYRYRLSGGDSVSRETKADFVEYPSLPPGDYKFEVESFGTGEGLSSNVAAFKFGISAPFWQRTWFILLVVLLILLVATLIIVKILRSNQRRHDLINRSLMAEQKLLQAQMNPHFIFNALNSIQQLFLENKKEAANDYLADFSSMVRMILENVRETTISLTDELRFIKVYLRMESLRLSDRFDFEIKVQPGLPIGNIQIPPMLIQPFLENAIWHGLAALKERRGKLCLDFSLEAGEVVCTIHDNGIGRERSLQLKQEYRKRHKSLAMNISRERIEALNSIEKRKASLVVKDEYDAGGNPTGTSVILKLPTQTSISS
jgi:ligand-binding sensor domain-containing protein